MLLLLLLSWKYFLLPGKKRKGKKRKKRVPSFRSCCSWRESSVIWVFLPLVDDWRSSSNTDANGDAQPSSLAAKGYRSVRPNLSSDSKPQVSLSSVTLRVIFWVQEMDSGSGALGWTPNFAANLGKLLCLSFSYLWNGGNTDVSRVLWSLCVKARHSVSLVDEGGG